MLGLCCSAGYSLAVVCTLLTAVASLVEQSLVVRAPVIAPSGLQSLHQVGSSHCTKWAPWLGCTDLAAQSHVESSWTWDRTGVSCIGKHILFHRATEEAPVFYLFIMIQIVHILSHLK